MILTLSPKIGKFAIHIHPKRRMSDTMTQEQRHRVMAAIHSASTKPELKLRLALWRLGFRYRVNDKRLPGTPDIVLPKHRTVIFVNGCFWHGHVGCKKFSLPDTNREFWAEKIERNRVRDINKWHELEVRGWNVITIWECELVKAKFQDTLNRVETDILANGAEYLMHQEQRRETNRAYREMRKAQKEREAALTAELLKK